MTDLDLSPEGLKRWCEAQKAECPRALDALLGDVQITSACREREMDRTFDNMKRWEALAALLTAHQQQADQLEAQAQEIAQLQEALQDSGVRAEGRRHAGARPGAPARRGTAGVGGVAA